MYCIQYDEICKKHNFELKHDALGERVTVHSGAKDFPSNNMSWCDWLNKPDDGHLLDVKTAR
jgi:hypothetical protein